MPDPLVVTKPRLGQFIFVLFFSFCMYAGVHFAVKGEGGMRWVSGAATLGLSYHYFVQVGLLFLRGPSLVIDERGIECMGLLMAWDNIALCRAGMRANRSSYIYVLNILFVDDGVETAKRMNPIMRSRFLLRRDGELTLDRNHMGIDGKEAMADIRKRRPDKCA